MSLLRQRLQEKSSSINNSENNQYQEEFPDEAADETEGFEESDGLDDNAYKFPDEDSNEFSDDFSGENSGSDESFKDASDDGLSDEGVKKKTKRKSLRSRVSSEDGGDLFETQGEPGSFSDASDLDKEEDWFVASSKKTAFKPKKHWYEEVVSNADNKEAGKEETGKICDYDMQEAFGFTDEEMEIIELKKQWAKERETRRYVIFTKIANVFLIIGCIYMIFLIFGVSVTDFQYSPNGKVEPQILGIQDIKEKKDFNVIKVEYEKCQMIYEKLLILNYRMENAEEGAQKVATEYQPLGDEIRTLYSKEQGVVANAKYTPLLKLMQEFLNSCQIYCDKVSTGYTSNNEQLINDAVILWNGGGVDQNGNAVISIQDQFINLHQNIVTMGEGLKGVDMLAIKQWRPDTYVDEYVNGKEADK